VNKKLFSTFAKITGVKTNEMIRIIVVDDHRLIRVTISAAFPPDSSDIAVVGDAESGKALFDLLATTPAELILLDVNLPDIGSAVITHRLRRDYPNLKILAISAEESVAIIKSMLEAGINGLISKTQGDPEIIAEAIHTVMAGKEYFSRDIASIMFNEYVSKKKTTGAVPDFSPREREVIELSGQGLLSKEIAARLNIKTSTVNTYKERIFQKLGINSVMEMVNYGLRSGVIKGDN
jgi:DNA-binding NarL/FixJ family response regulator